MASTFSTCTRHSIGFQAPLQSNKYCPILVALIAVIIVPYLHIGVFYLKFWVPDKQAVNKEECRCSCFDTVFKGSYESPGNSRYKHVYFNATQNTFMIWAVTVVFMFMFYESLKYLMLLFQNKQLQLSWVVLYTVNIYPNYYSWWMLFGYYNDEFYRYLPHQIYFGVTELAVTALVLTLCNKQVEPQLWKILLIIAISLVHIFVSSLDQFITNVILRQGKAFQNSRDFGLMIPDLLHLLVAAFWYLYCVCVSRDHAAYVKSKDHTSLLPLWSKVCTGTRKRDFSFLVIVVLFLVSLSHVL